MVCAVAFAASLLTFFSGMGRRPSAPRPRARNTRSTIRVWSRCSGAPTLSPSRQQGEPRRRSPRGSSGCRETSTPAAAAAPRPSPAAPSAARRQRRKLRSSSGASAATSRRSRSGARAASPAGARPLLRPRGTAARRSGRERLDASSTGADLRRNRSSRSSAAQPGHPRGPGHLSASRAWRTITTFVRVGTCGISAHRQYSWRIQQRGQQPGRCESVRERISLLCNSTGPACPDQQQQPDQHRAQRRRAAALLHRRIFRLHRSQVGGHGARAARRRDLCRAIGPGSHRSEPCASASISERIRGRSRPWLNALRRCRTKRTR